MPGITVGDHRQHEDFLRYLPARSIGDPDRAHQIDIEWQVRAMLLDGPAGNDANFLEFDRIIDLRPGQFFVTVLDLRP